MTTEDIWREFEDGQLDFLKGFELDLPPPSLERSTTPPPVPTATMVSMDSVRNYATLPPNARPHNLHEDQSDAYGMTGLMAVVGWTDPCYGTVAPGTIFLFPGSYYANPPAYQGTASLKCSPHDPLLCPSKQSVQLHKQMCGLLGQPTTSFIGFACVYPFNAPDHIVYHSRTCNIYWFGTKELPSEWQAIVFCALAAYLPLPALCATTGSAQRLEVTRLCPGNALLYEAAYRSSSGDWYVGSSTALASRAFSGLAVGNSSNGSLQAIGLDGRYNYPYLAVWQDSTGTWHRGHLLPDNSTQFFALAVGNDNTGALQVIGLGTKDGYAYRAAWLDTTGTWQPGSALPSQSISFSALAVGSDSSGQLMVIGLGTSDSYAYLAASCKDGTWSAGNALPLVYKRLSALAVGRGTSGTLEVVGIGADDAHFYRVASFQNGTLLHHGSTTAIGTRRFSALAVGNGVAGTLMVFGIDPDDSYAYMAAYESQGGYWYAGTPLPGSTVPLSALATGKGADGSLQLIGLRASDGYACVVAWQDTEGEWHPGTVLPGQNTICHGPG